MRGLVRYVVFFGMKLKTRGVAIAGITHQPDDTWMAQIAEPHRSGRRLPARHPARHPRSRSAVHRGLSAAAAGSWRHAAGPACAESKLECVRRTVCRVGQV